jgi:hypothetical protein
MSNSPQIWLTGNIDHADFASAKQWLHEVARCEVISSGSTPASGTEFPAAIVFFQARPGAVQQSNVERLHRQAPLAKLFFLAGPWCEGELRSGRPPHGITRILWHQWRLRLPRELGRLPNPRRPRTWSPTDLLLETLPAQVKGYTARGAAAICTDRRESFESLADLCRLVGLRPVWQQRQSLPNDDGPAVVIAQGWQALADMPCDEGPRPPVILVLDWPRPDDLARAGQLGIRHVLSQPLLITDLLATLEELLPVKAVSGAASPTA